MTSVFFFYLAAGVWRLTSTEVTFCGSKPSHTSMLRESPTARSTRTASVCVMPSKLWLFTSRMRMPTCSRPSLAAAPTELTCLKDKGHVSTTTTAPVSVRRRAALDHLGDEDTLVGGIEGVSCVALCPPTNADAKFLARLLLDHNLLQQHGHRSSVCCCLLQTSPQPVAVGGPTCIPGGDGSLRTSMRISCLLAKRARTASWCVAWRRSMEFTSNIRSPTRRPL